MKRAMGMMLTGRHVPAEEGYELGFVNEVSQQSATIPSCLH
jgi:enoyl-CoA hydratase/carnithine racemase